MISRESWGKQGEDFGWPSSWLSDYWEGLGGRYLNAE